jgi:hypothetical protein
MRTTKVSCLLTLQSADKGRSERSGTEGSWSETKANGRSEAKSNQERRTKNYEPILTQAESASGCAESAGVVDTGKNVVAGQDRVSDDDVIDGVARAQVGKDRFHGDACSCYNGPPVAHFGMDFDSGIHDEEACFRAKLVILKEG